MQAVSENIIDSNPSNNTYTVHDTVYGTTSISYNNCSRWPPAGIVKPEEWFATSFDILYDTVVQPNNSTSDPVKIDFISTSWNIDVYPSIYNNPTAWIPIHVPKGTVRGNYNVTFSYTGATLQSLPVEVFYNDRDLAAMYQPELYIHTDDKYCIDNNLVIPWTEYCMKRIIILLDGGQIIIYM